MGAPDTTAPIIPEVVDQADQAGDMLADMLGPLAGLIPPGLFDALAGAVPDPEAATLDDLDESLTLILSRLDWVHDVLVDVVGKLPPRFRPTLPAWPVDLD